MKLQAEAYYDLLREATSIKEEEMKRKFQCELEDKIDELKTEGRVNIAGMVGRLKGYNDAITSKWKILSKSYLLDTKCKYYFYFVFEIIKIIQIAVLNECISWSLFY